VDYTVEIASDSMTSFMVRDSGIQVILRLALSLLLSVYSLPWESVS
jgi:hypothetical protein